MFEARCTNGAGSWSATGFGGKGQRSLSREVGMSTSVALTSGEPVLAQANPFTWAWYELPLEISINEFFYCVKLNLTMDGHNFPPPEHRKIQMSKI